MSIKNVIKKVVGDSTWQKIRTVKRSILKQDRPRLYFSVKDLWIEEKAEINKALSFGVYYVYGTCVEGDIAEFGTMSGSTAQAIATAMVSVDLRNYNQKKLKKKLHLFDSFEGLPEAIAEADVECPHVKDGFWGAGKCLILGEEELKKVCTRILPEKDVVIYKGWFKDTVSNLPEDTRFSMLNVDGDLYQSAMDSLGACFEKGFVSKGAIVFFDDWNCNHASRDFGERKAWAELVEKHEIKFSDEGAYSWNAHKFIVHDYKGMPKD